MPANLSPSYHHAEKRFKEAATSSEKILALEEMLAVIPKHKGTEKMQADIKKRLSKFRNAEDKSGGKKSDPYNFPWEGAGRAVVVGAPNSGKSALVAALSGVQLEVAPYPFTTQKPAPIMVPFEDIQIQVIDTPPVTPDRIEVFHLNLARTTDIIICTVALGEQDPARQFRETKEVFENKKIEFSSIKDNDSHNYGIAKKKTLLVLTGCDMDEDDILLSDFKDNVETDLELFLVSSTTRARIEEFRKILYERLEVVRVYSKIPGNKPDMASPFVLVGGSTVQDVAKTVHKDFAENLRYARIWGSEKFDGQQVQRDYVVHDGDIIELHM